MSVLSIPITKASASLEVETDDLSPEVYQAAMVEGLKVLLNKRMSKIVGLKTLEGEQLAEAKAAAMKIAEANLADLLAGKITKARSTGASKVPGVVMTEARRLAKEIVKNEIRRAGLKVSHVEASEITKLANELIAADPSYIEQATANIESRSAKPVAISIAGMVHESPKLKARAEKAKATAKETLSAKQAGKVKVRPARHAQ